MAGQKDAIKVPPGFTLDAPHAAASGITPPSGFILDPPNKIVPPPGFTLDAQPSGDFDPVAAGGVPVRSAPIPKGATIEPAQGAISGDDPIFPAPTVAQAIASAARPHITMHPDPGMALDEHGELYSGTPVSEQGAFSVPSLIRKMASFGRGVEDVAQGMGDQALQARDVVNRLADRIDARLQGQPPSRKPTTSSRPYVPQITNSPATNAALAFATVPAKAGYEAVKSFVAPDRGPQQSATDRLLESTGRVMGTAAGGELTGVNDDIIDSLGSTPEEIAKNRAQKLAAALNARGADIDYAGHLRTVLPELDITASRMGRPRTLADLATNLERTGNRLEAEFQQDMLNPYRDHYVSGAPISDAIRDRITPELRKTDPELAGALESEAQRYEQPYTLGELNDLRTRRNAGNRTFYLKPEAAQLADLKTRARTIADVTAADAARDVLYGTLEDLTGRDMRPLKRMEGAIRDLRQPLTDRLQDLQNRVLAEKGLTNPLDRIRAHAYASPEGRVHAYVGGLQDFFRPRSAHELDIANKSVRKAFRGPLDFSGRVSTEPTISSTEPPRATLTPEDLGPAPYRGGGAVDIVGPTRQSEIPLAGHSGVLRRPLGLLPAPSVDTFEETPPDPYFFVAQQPSVSLLPREQLHRELGSTAATVPSQIMRAVISSRGSEPEIAAAERRARLGAQGSTVPDRVLGIPPSPITEAIRVRVAAPDGRTGTIPMTDLPRALEKGYRRLDW